jgi:hypothetical protein
MREVKYTVVGRFPINRDIRLRNQNNKTARARIQCRRMARHRTGWEPRKIRTAIGRLPEMGAWRILASRGTMMLTHPASNAGAISE